MFHKVSGHIESICVYYISNKIKIQLYTKGNYKDIGKRSIDLVCLLEMDGISYWSVIGHIDCA